MGCDFKSNRISSNLNPKMNLFKILYLKKRNVSECPQGIIKGNVFFEKFVFYFLKFEKVLLLMLTLFIFSIFDCLTNEPCFGALVNITL